MNLKNPMFSFPSGAAKGHGGLSWTLARKSLLDYEEKNVDYIDAYLANFALRQRPSTIIPWTVNIFLARGEILDSLRRKIKKLGKNKKIKAITLC